MNKCYSLIVAFLLSIAQAPAYSQDKALDSQTYEPPLSARDIDCTDRSNHISVEISRIAPYLRNVPNTFEKADAVLVLLFKNSGNKEMRVPCQAFACGKGAPLVTPKEFKPSCRIKIKSKDLDYPCFGVQSSRLHYSWSDEGDHPILSENICVATERITIPPKGSASVTSPIRLPTQGGTYRLSVTFDNRSLAQVNSGANNRLINEMVHRGQFVERSANATIEVEPIPIQN